MSLKLRDFIVKVRGCKTSAEERAVISKECALIRTSFKDPSAAIAEYYRPRNILKLLFVHLLNVNNSSGNIYPNVAQYAQLECMKLIGKNLFYHKQAGYLALSVLIRDDETLLTLVTNSIAIDLQKYNSNETIDIFESPRFGRVSICFLQAVLALNALGNLNSKEVVETLWRYAFSMLNSKETDSILKRKAILCLVPVLRTDPNAAEDILEKIILIMNAETKTLNSIPMLISCFTVLNQVIISTGKIRKEFKKELFSKIRQDVVLVVSALVNKLTSSSSKLFDDSSSVGIPEPFLIEEILQFVISAAEFVPDLIEAVSPLINDLISQNTAAGNSTKKQKNMVSGIVLQCIKTILFSASSINEGSAFRSDFVSLERLCVKELISFLVVDLVVNPKDDNNANVNAGAKNMRFLAFATINKLIIKNPSKFLPLFESTKQPVIQCLEDDDPSIVRSAVNLIFTILEANNANELIPHLMAFLRKPSSNDEIKQVVVEKLLKFVKVEVTAEEMTSLERWKLALNILTVGGEFVPDSLWMFIINLLFESKFDSDDKWKNLTLLHLALIVSCSLNEGLSSIPVPILKIFIFLVGESGNYLSDYEGKDWGSTFKEKIKPFGIEIPGNFNPNFAFTMAFVGQCFDKIFASTLKEVKPLVISAVAKLKKTKHIQDKELVAKFDHELKYYSGSANIQVQTRAIEYSVALASESKIRLNLERNAILGNFVIASDDVAVESEAEYGELLSDDGAKPKPHLNELDGDDSLLGFEMSPAEPSIKAEKDEFDFF